jgi:hypothetical protein
LVPIEAQHGLGLQTMGNQEVRERGGGVTIDC